MLQNFIETWMVSIYAFEIQAFHTYLFIKYTFPVFTSAEIFIIKCNKRQGPCRMLGRLCTQRLRLRTAPLRFPCMHRMYTCCMFPQASSWLPCLGAWQLCTSQSSDKGHSITHVDTKWLMKESNEWPLSLMPEFKRSYLPLSSYLPPLFCGPGHALFYQWVIRKLLLGNNILFTFYLKSIRGKKPISWVI